MAYAEKLVKSWRACWYVPGKKTPEKESGFATEREALRHAQEQEVDARRQGRARTDAGRLLLSEYAATWLEAQDLEPATMRNYRSILTNHLVRSWGDLTLRELENLGPRIDVWRNELRRHYAHNTASLITGVFSTLCADAVADGFMARNPALAKRRRGRQAPKRLVQQENRYGAVTDPLGAFLVAERCAALSGRDDEFLFLTTKYYLGLRLGELMGLEKRRLSHSMELTHQLTEGAGRLWWKGVKNGSERTIDVPPFLLRLLVRQARQVQHPTAADGVCPCGQGVDEDTYRHEAGIHVFAGLGSDPHLNGNLFRSRYFMPAARAMYYAGTKQECPVFQTDAEDPFSFVATGQGVRRPKDPAACWAPICPDMKPHGLRHSAQTLMESRGIPKALVMDRMGHARAREANSVYSHVTASMRAELVEVLEGAWSEALARREQMGVTSPVGVVRELLGQDSAQSHSRFTPDLGSRLQVAGGVG